MTRGDIEVVDLSPVSYAPQSADLVGGHVGGSPSELDIFCLFFVWNKTTQVEENDTS